MKETRNRNQKIEKKKKIEKGPREPLGPGPGKDPVAHLTKTRTGIPPSLLLSLTRGTHPSARVIFKL
jgi:hypothetical protein